MYEKNVDGEIIEMTCRELGASKVMELEGSLYYVEFAIAGCCVLSYTFNVNGQNDYRLQRLQPYPFVHDLLNKEEDVINLIKKDLARFRNAAKSSNFERFIDVLNALTAIGDDMDDLFLNFNVDRDALTGIAEHIEKIRDHIAEVRLGSKTLIAPFPHEDV